MRDFDVIVLGGGSAGSSAAAAAAEAGARVAMINDGELGGLCILRGCMPTKAMLASAHAVHAAEHTDAFGVRLEGRVVPEFGRIMRRKDELVARFQRAKIRSIEASDYEVIAGRGRFAAGGGIEVDGRKLTARSFVIATGSVPVVLRIPGIEDVPVLTSDDVMRLEKPPRSLLVQGAGPIGLELAQFFARIGTELLLVNRSPLLSRYDVEAGAELTLALRDESRLELAVPATIERLRRNGEGLVAEIRTNRGLREYHADALLMAAGRRAALDDLGLDRVGLTAPDGRLEHDPEMRTHRREIFVAGDATGTYQVLHLSNQEGRIAGRNAAGADPPKRMDYSLEMGVIFTDPPFAHVGRSESAATRDGHEVVVGRARFPETGRAITMETRYGLWKLLADRRNGRVLGASILGPRADDLIHLVALMMRYEARVQELPELPWYHPTLSEVVLELCRDMAHRLA